jgi:hypothetical protein
MSLGRLLSSGLLRRNRPMRSDGIDACAAMEHYWSDTAPLTLVDR